MILRYPENNIYPAQTYSDHSCYSYEHGGHGAAETADKSRSNVHESAEKVGEHNVGHSHKSVFYGFLGIGNIDAEERLSEEKCSCTKCCSRAEDSDKAYPHYLSDTVEFACTEVLTCEVKSGLAVGVHGCVHEAFNVLSGGISRVDNGTE